MGFTKPIEQILLSYQGTINVSEYMIRGEDYYEDTDRCGHAKRFY